MTENRVVAMPSASRTIALPLANIYAIVDVSSSMRGAKIDTVCSSIRSMFTSWPPGVNFQVTIFNNRTSTIVSGSKISININDAIDGIKRSCSHGAKTALYDAWGEVLTSIPNSAGYQTQVFIISDGDDNCSTLFSLQEVKAVTEEKKASGVQITFIQVGATNGRQAIGGLRYDSIRILSVENSSRGVRLALSDVNNRIRQQLQTGSAGNGSNLRRLESRRTLGENRSTFTVNKQKYLPRRK